MKIFANRILNINGNSVDKVRGIKTEPYSADSFVLTTKLKPQKSFWQNVRTLFGLRIKLNPKSFADGLNPPKGPYYASRQSVDLTNEYIKSNCLLENEKIIDGFKDGGRNAVFDKFGDVIKAQREIIIVDREKDMYLSNSIRYVKDNTKNMSEDKKLKFIYNLMHDISGDFVKGDRQAELLGKKYVGKEILLGEIFERECASCRHKALMFKILAEEAGLQTRMLRGLAFDLGGYGGHAWNEVKLKNGRKLLVDIQNSAIIDISTSKAMKNPKLAGYKSSDNLHIYK